jgi:hypothetical protein
MTFTLSDGTDVEYHILTPAVAAAAVSRTSDDASMFVEMIRLAVVNPVAVLERIATLPDSVEETALLGTEIIIATLQAEAGD